MQLAQRVKNTICQSKKKDKIRNAVDYYLKTKDDVKKDLSYLINDWLTAVQGSDNGSSHKVTSRMASLEHRDL